MTAKSYVPECGHVVWLRLKGQGRRPALVLSPALYNQRSGLALCCPVQAVGKGYPFDVDLPEGLAQSLPAKGVVQCDQVRSLDWKEHKAALICTVPVDVVDSVRARIAPLLGL